MLGGWSPAEVTTLTRDANGEVVGWVTKRESDFDEEQLDMLIAYQAYRRSIGPHGHPYSEATDPGADPNEYDTPYRYVAEGPFTDWAEKAEKDAQQQWQKDNGDNSNMNGLFWTVKKIEY